VQLHKIPKSSVDVFVMVLESGGADLAVAITAASVSIDRMMDGCEINISSPSSKFQLVKLVACLNSQEF
jgi:ribonuclease PH